MDAAEARSLLETTRLLSEQLHAEPHLPTPPTTSSTTSSTTSTNSSSAPSSGLALDSSLLAELSNSLCSFLPSAKMNPKGLLNPVVDPPPVSPPAASAPFLPRAVPQAAPVLAPTTRPLSPALSTPSVPLAPPTLLHSPRTPLPTLLPTPVGLGLFPLPRPLPLPSLAFAVSADRSVTMSRDADTRVLSFHCKEISTHLGQLIHPPGSECWHAAGTILTDFDAPRTVCIQAVQVDIVPLGASSDVSSHRVALQDVVLVVADPQPVESDSPSSSTGARLSYGGSTVRITAFFYIVCELSNLTLSFVIPASKLSTCKMPGALTSTAPKSIPASVSVPIDPRLRRHVKPPTDVLHVSPSDLPHVSPSDVPEVSARDLPDVSLPKVSPLAEHKAAPLLVEAEKKLFEVHLPPLSKQYALRLKRYKFSDDALFPSVGEPPASPTRMALPGCVGSSKRKVDWQLFDMLLG